MTLTFVVALAGRKQIKRVIDIAQLLTRFIAMRVWWYFYNILFVCRFVWHNERDRIPTLKISKNLFSFYILDAPKNIQLWCVIETIMWIYFYCGHFGFRHLFIDQYSFCFIKTNQKHFRLIKIFLKYHPDFCLFFMTIQLCK